MVFVKSFVLCVIMWLDDAVFTGVLGVFLGIVAWIGAYGDSFTEFGLLLGLLWGY